MQAAAEAFAALGDIVSGSTAGTVAASTVLAWTVVAMLGADGGELSKEFPWLSMP